MMLSQAAYHKPVPQGNLETEQQQWWEKGDSLNAEMDLIAARKVFWEDWDMEDASNARTEYASAGSGQSCVQRYLTVDTNVFMNHLSLVEKVLNALSVNKGYGVSLLVPTVVVHELEKLGSFSYQGDVADYVRRDRISRARLATKWLLATIDNRPDAAIRYQLWIERGTGYQLPEHPTADDRVLDCALHFQRTDGGEALLWTEDTNLMLKTKIQGVRAIPAPVPGLQVILRFCGLPILGGDDAEAGMNAAVGHHSVPELDDSASDRGMEIDADFLPPPSAPMRSLRTIINTSTPHTHTSHRPSLSLPGPRTSQSSSSSFRNARPSHITRSAIPSDILARLTLLSVVLSPFFAPSPSPNPAYPSIPTSLSTRRALDTLGSALASRDSGTSNNPPLIRLRWCIDTLANWVRPSGNTMSQQPVLSSEAARDLEGVLEVLPQIEVSLDRADDWDEVLRGVGEYREVVDQIRAL